MLNKILYYDNHGIAVTEGIFLGKSFIEINKMEVFKSMYRKSFVVKFVFDNINEEKKKRFEVIIDFDKDYTRSDAVCNKVWKNK